MPSMIAHMLCGEKGITISSCDKLRTIIKNNKNAFNLGCQGPDPFMYYSMLPWDKQPNVEKNRDYSDVIHYGLPTKFFGAALKHIKEHYSDAKVAYICGFIAHHALDSTAHPYVYYETATSQDKSGGNLHVIFEKQLDLAMLQQFGLTNKEFKGHKRITQKKESLKAICELVADSINEAFDGEAKEEEIANSFVGMVKGETLMYDPYNIKRGLLLALGGCVGKRDLIEGMMLPHEYDEKLDVLNKEKRVWYEPTDETIAHHEDFMQIFNLAAVKTANRLAAIENYLNDKESLESVLEVIGNASYENGTVDKKMYYYKRDQK